MTTTTQPTCEGSCEDRDGHQGPIRLVRSFGTWTDWGTFHYCEAAIAEDRRRGLTVELVEEDAGDSEELN